MRQKSLRLATFARMLRPALVAVLAGTLVLVLGLGFRIQSALNTLQEQPVDNLNWNLAQVEVDLVRFVDEIHIVRVDPSEPVKELRKRFDLFYSRAQNAINGQSFTGAEVDDLAKPLGVALAAYLASATPRIDADDATLHAALPAMEDEATALRETLRKMSIGLVARFAALNDQRRTEFAALVRETALASGVALGLVLLLLALVILLNREAGREAQQTARVSDRLASTVNSALDAIIVADEAGRILQYNPSAESILGFTPHEAIGQKLGALIVPQHLRAAHENGMAHLQATGQMKMVGSGRFQTTALRKSGVEFPVEMSISAVTGDDGRIFVAYLRDISKRVAAETALTVARDEALAAERSKTNFLAVMSHEMRTPLNGVLAALEITARLVRDKKASHFITLARNSAIQLLRHANDVLDISRTETGGLQLVDEDFELGEVLEGLVEALRPVAAAKDLNLRLDGLQDLPRLRGDPFRIGQIVQNFLSNAIKFTILGEITVEYEVQETHSGSLIIEIRVIDTGPGIAEQDQARIFEDFVMLDPSFGRSDGAGLGLAISRRLASAMDGEVGVESDLGAGCCFWLRLPLDLARGTSANAQDALADASHPAQDVLVVEDNATNRAVLEEMLTHLGHRVVLACDGGEGMALARARRFDLILMDISMPLMDGLTATALIRMEGASADSRIVAVTAHSMPADLERFRDAGMDSVLVKPISSDALSKVLAGDAVQQTETASVCLDPERIADLRQAMDFKAMAAILTKFLTDSPVLHLRIAEAVRRGDDAASLMALCHEAAGAAAVLGALRLATHFFEAENHCRTGDLVAAQACLSQDTARLWDETRAAMDEILGQSPADGDA